MIRRPAIRRHRTPEPFDRAALEPDTAYTGPAVLGTDTGPLDVEVHLNGHFEPLDGRFHWYGRVDGTGLDRIAGHTRSRLTLAVGTGAPRPATLGEQDPWGHFRISGTGAPPFPLEGVEADQPIP